MGSYCIMHKSKEERLTQIKCPNCGTPISLDAADYANIVNQVRTAEFDKDLKEATERIQEQQKLKLSQELQNAEKKYSDSLSEKESMIIGLKEQIAEANKNSELSEKDAEGRIKEIQASYDAEIKNRNELINAAVQKAVSEKNAEIASLNAALDTERANQKTLIAEKTKDKDEQIARLQATIEAKNTERDLAIETAKKEALDSIRNKEEEIVRLNAELKAKETEKDLAVAKANQESTKELSDKDLEISRLNNELLSKKTEMQLALKQADDRYNFMVKIKDDEIERYKDFKAKQSTKMLGESLEVYCHTQFDMIRATAFPNAYFEKDNQVIGGSKGDFIFRDYQDGEEIVSIMFDMKNEADTTSTKHTNDDFFDKLDKDRKNKKCEYAILVSTLEPDNALYNVGITDVSYRYEKMYVIRPQYFIPIISILRNTSLGSIKLKKQLTEIREENLDYTRFKSNLDSFKADFDRSYKYSGERFKDAIDGIDKAIKNLQNIKDNLMKSEKHLQAASNKLEDLTIPKLTKDSPIIRAKFEELAQS